MSGASRPPWRRCRSLLSGVVPTLLFDPVATGFPFVRADKDGDRRLIVRDGQHEYVFEEAE